LYVVLGLGHEHTKKVTPEGLVVIDFKTDQLTAEQLPERADLYRPQLDLYAKAAAAILKTPSAAKYLYFLGLRVAVQVR